MNIPLTLLYVPADQPHKVVTALASEADVVIIDLEDAVTPGHKDAARDALPELVASASAAGRQIQVRVNAPGSPWLTADLAAVDQLPPSIGARLPKMDDPEQVCRIAERLGERALHLLIESALGVERAFALASVRRSAPATHTTGFDATTHLASLRTTPTTRAIVATIAIGEADLRSDLGLTSERGLLWARSRIVNAARAAGLPAPSMSAYPNVSDLPGLAASCARGRELGFVGRTAVHPRQLATIAASFRPTTDELSAARAILAAVARATESGNGAVLLEDGSFLDVAMVEGARKTVALAETHP